SVTEMIRSTAAPRLVLLRLIPNAAKLCPQDFLHGRPAFRSLIRLRQVFVADLVLGAEDSHQRSHQALVYAGAYAKHQRFVAVVGGDIGVAHVRSYMDTR